MNAHSKKAEDENFMREALKLARQGVGWVDPNPAVGCVIVRDGRIIGRGYHTKFGCAHAEREALKDCTQSAESAAGATAYVTLEPCSHTGKQPPCTEAIIAAGIKRVVVGQQDPNPLVSGRGIEQLQAAGVQVCVGVLQRECEHFNRAWRHYITHGTPYVIMKYATTACGGMTPAPGAHVQLTGRAAQARTHEDRAAVSAIMVGAGTVLSDDPQLTCRLDEFCAEGAARKVAESHAEGTAECAAGSDLPHARPTKIKQPLRIVLSASANVPLNSRLVKSVSADAPVLVIASAAAHAASAAVQERVRALRASGVEVQLLPAVAGTISAANTQINWQDILQLLGARGVVSLLVEGGPALHAGLAASGCVNEVQAYVAGKIFPKSISGASGEGGTAAKGVAGDTTGAGGVLETASDANLRLCNSADSSNILDNMLNLSNPTAEVLGQDVLITWSVATKSRNEGTDNALRR